METRVSSLNIGLSSALSLTCLILLSTSASAQVGNAAKVRMQEMDKRELQLSDLSKGNPKEADPRRAEAIKNQINEDFHRILKLHNDMVRVIGSKSPLDYHLISDATGEINKRATRLRSTLALQILAPAEQNQQPAPPDLPDMQTRDGLVKLCRKIELFVKNPVIDTPGTVDAQQLDNARRDLNSVIELSGAIKKDAGRQKKLR